MMHSPGKHDRITTFSNRENSKAVVELCRHGTIYKMICSSPNSGKKEKKSFLHMYIWSFLAHKTTHLLVDNTEHEHDATQKAQTLNTKDNPPPLCWLVISNRGSDG
jgi:hypothetical protein